MSNVNKRIWAWEYAGQNTEGQWRASKGSCPAIGYEITPYVRADQLDAALAANRELVRQLAEVRKAGDAPDWEGFARDMMDEWPVRDVDGSELFEAALKHRLIREIDGGYDPDQHIDAEGISPEPGDPWYEYTFSGCRNATTAKEPTE